MGVRAAIVSLVLAGAPAAVAADRGALTLDLGPALSLLNATPSQGAGSATLATGGGGTLGVRYALSNSLEVGAFAVWEAPADYFHSHSGVEFAPPTGRVRGTLTERAQRYGALAGVHYVRGFVWRLHLGAELGWTRETFTRRDLLDVSDPANVHSFGLGLRDRTSDALVLAPVAGLEWQFADHWSVSVMPRAQFLVGGTSRVGLLVPVTLGYSWFVF